MNSYKLNSIIAGATRYSICKFLGIEHAAIYKEVKSITPTGIVTTKVNKKYQITLEHIKTKREL